MKELSFQHKLFASFKAHDSRVAVEYGDRTVSYSELEQKAMRVYRWIIRQKIEKGQFIGISIDDRVEFTAAVIGVLAAGCVFVPLETSLPEKRVELMLRLTGASYVLTADYLWPSPASLGPGAGLAEETAGSEYNPNDPVYVYFTSGSSGAPRAITGKNESLLHFIRWEIDAFGVDENTRVSQLTNPGFDAFLRDVFTPLCAGGRVCIPPSAETVMNGGELCRWLDRGRVNLVHCTPGIFRLIDAAGPGPGNFKHLKYIAMSGEHIRPYGLKNWFRVFGERIQLVNLYGPTETTMIKTCYFIRPQDAEAERIPAGKPIKGAQVIIFDENMTACAGEIAGEIYIRTPYSTLGYCNDPESTNGRFRVNPFTGDAGDILYKTGDSGRISGDGNLYLLGRLDRQVKVRGIRVEPEEIENHLLRFNGVIDAVVAPMGAGAGKEGDSLCAYFVSGEELAVPELRKFMAAQLPGYMTPSYFMRLERIPLTRNRKIDYRALPLPSPGALAARQRTAPCDETEKKLARLWAEVLNLDENAMGIDDDFFHLGGHSLKGAVLVSRIQNLTHVQVPLAEIFKNPTIRQLASYIRAQGEAGRCLETYVSDEQIILLRKGSANRHVFFIHHVSGEVEAYLDLVNLLPGTYHYWGIRAEGPERFVARDLSIEEVAGSYIEKVETLQPLGPYYIIGWSIGGTIAFEMQRRLEEVGGGGGVLVLIDSAPPAAPFVEHNVIDVSPPLKRLIPRLEQLGEREISYYLAVARAFGGARGRYIPGGKTRSAVHFISAADAGDGDREMVNRGDWNLFCEKPVTFHKAAGDHFSILEVPNVGFLADIIAALLPDVPRRLPCL
ncbi:MAG: amino acid adenylation domain-containing protein [Candidatus Aminicenantes bacterium]|nr:amino acid adenylation domain-containing protein [Candidatus Aminicenantes bacterium]